MGLADGLLLCVGCDGYASLHSGLHSHGHAETPVANHDAPDDHKDGHSHCSRCVDIPLSMDVVERYVGSDPVSFSLSADSAGCGAGDVWAERTDLHPEQMSDSTSFFIPLSTIVLVV